MQFVFAILPMIGLCFFHCGEARADVPLRHGASLQALGSLPARGKHVTRACGSQAATDNAMARSGSHHTGPAIIAAEIPFRPPPRALTILPTALATPGVKAYRFRGGLSPPLAIHRSL